LSATEAQDLLFERRGSTAVVTFNRPQARNAMTFAMYEALYERCEEVDADDGVRALVLRGAGGKAFVAGTDIAQFRAFESRQDALDYEETIDRIVGRVEVVRKPTIAQVDGYAVGGGLAIASACDLRVCTPAAKFGLPIARTLGNCLSMENYSRLVALIGPARVKDLVFTARTVGAEEALAIGLATQIVSPSDIDDRVAELCERLAGHAPITLRVTKEALRRLRSAGLPDGDDLVLEAYTSEDFRRAVEAFVTKERRPEWRGS
jgi:enoyl-CoA hydratase/carnithine racemase